MHGRAGPQHGLGQRRGRVDHVLAVVEHQQELPAGQRMWPRAAGDVAGAEFEPDRRGDRGRNQAGIGKRRELGEPDAVGKFRQQLARGRDGEPRLADAAGAGEGDQPMRGGKADDFAQFIVPPDQLGDRLRQVGRRQGRSGLRRGRGRAGALSGPAGRCGSRR